jgi:hypothetical protein
MARASIIIIDDLRISSVFISQRSKLEGRIRGNRSLWLRKE